RNPGAIGEPDQADADADPEAASLVNEARLLDHAPDLLGHVGGGFASPAGATAQQDTELVAAEPRDQSAISGLAGQQFRDLLQEPVARDVAAGVVDDLELIEVEQHEMGL